MEIHFLTISLFIGETVYPERRHEEGERSISTCKTTWYTYPLYRIFLCSRHHYDSSLGQHFDLV